MLPIVITTEDIVSVDDEIADIATLINRFGCRVHLRKKKCSEQQMACYCEQLIEKVDRHLLTMHDFPQLVEHYALGGYHANSSDIAYYSALWGDGVIYSLSCHSMDEADGVADNINYLFLSPIYDSISKQGYRANFEKTELKKWLGKGHKTKIVALGGIDRGNIGEVKKLGFDGAALLGAIWNKEEAVLNYENILLSDKNLLNSILISSDTNNENIIR